MALTKVSLLLFMLDARANRHDCAKLFSQVEFAVPMTCQRCVDAIRGSIANVEGIQDIDISLERGTVVVKTNLPCSVIQERIEKTGKQAVLKGYGGLNIHFFFIC